MLEVIEAAFSPINLVFTILLLVVLLYWLMVIVGLFDLSFLDFDADFGTDIDADFEVDFDADIGLDGGFLRGILGFFYIGEVPVMVLCSVLIVSLWAFSMIGNHYVNPNGSFITAMPIFGANLLVSGIICKILGMPLRKVFNVFDEDANAPKKVIGRICIVATTEITSNLGQAEVKTKGAPILLNVMAQQGCTFKKGDEAVVMRNDKEKGVYIIAPIELEK
jgi:hypothetical protein